MVKVLPIKSGEHKIFKAAKKFIKTNDFGDIIHLYPLTCIHEIVAQSTFNDIRNEYDILIISLIIDELSG